METNFMDLTWHDAELVEIRIDRRNPGHVDNVEMIFRTAEGTFGVCFKDCRAVTMEMNFGIIALESVREVSVATESPRVEAARQLWNSMGVELNHLRHYTFEFNSTASLISIIAESVSIKPVK